jgi:hypothetical protein
MACCSLLWLLWLLRLSEVPRSTFCNPCLRYILFVVLCE